MEEKSEKSSNDQIHQTRNINHDKKCRLSSCPSSSSSLSLAVISILFIIVSINLNNANGQRSGGANRERGSPSLSSSSSSLPTSSPSPSLPYYGTLLGRLNTHHHDASGDVYAVDESTIFIKGFTYDGTGPDAYFWAGSTNRPDPSGFIIPDEKGS